jgi:Domain of unknown function (DUF4412)
MQFRTGSVALALLAIAMPAAADELTMVSKMTRDGASSTATSYLSSDRARTVQPGGQEAIIDFKTGQITSIDNNKREYFVITRQDMEQMKARLQETMNSPEMQRAQEQMKNLPPEVQKKMQGMMGGMAASVDVHKLGTSRKIAGYSCDDWTMTMGTFSKTEECLTTELPLPPQAWTAYKDFADSMQSMMASFGPMAKGMTELQAKMRDMRGYPLAVSTTVGMMGRSMATSSEVVEVKRGPIPASAWEVPAGYKKVENPMLKAQMGPRH